jgi:hypothetical protein
MALHLQRCPPHFHNHFDNLTTTVGVLMLMVVLMLKARSPEAPSLQRAILRQPLPSVFGQKLQC